MQYDLGDGVSLRHEVRDADGDLTAATVTLTVTAPSGATSTPVVSTASTGIYDAAAFTADETGPWTYVWAVSGVVVDSTHGAFSVANPVPPLYVPLDLLRSSLGISDPDRDQLLQQALSAACRVIDSHTGRRFYADPVPVARTFRTLSRTVADRDGYGLLVDDIASNEVTVETGSGVAGWTSLELFDLEPDNALVRGEPVTMLRNASAWGTSRVRITTRWGWPAVPDVVAQAALIQASRLYKRKDSPEGVMGSADWGPIRLSRIDPDVQALLQPLVLPGIA